MERFATLLLNVWREACRHVEMGAALEQAAPELFRGLPFSLVLVRRLDLERSMVETIAVGRCRPGEPPAVRRHEPPREEFERLLAWCRQRQVLTCDAGERTDLPRWTIPEGLAGQLLVGPLVGERGPLGLVVFVTQPPRRVQPRHIEIVTHLLEPFTVWIENDRRLHELRVLRAAAEAENVSLRNKLGKEGLGDTVVGAETGLRDVMQRVEQVARTDVPVLILGESGSGKEVVARAIHERSARAKGPFLRVNCGAISPELIDSELFGHERGSFTGATSQRKGWFERADGGTLLLDECGELTPGAQVRLLRVLQDGIFERVGGETPVSVDVRIVAATHRNLEAMTAEGTFRHDLWYRLAIFPIRLPPLRERQDDVAAMAAHFVRRSTQRLGMPPLRLLASDIELLTRYPWPGNVRELAAVIERAVILGDGKRIEIAAALGAQPVSERSPAGVSTTAPSLDPVQESRPAGFPTLDEAMRHHIAAALRHTHGRIEGPFGAARLLRINPHTLRGRMRNLGLRWGDFRSTGRFGGG